MPSVNVNPYNVGTNYALGSISAGPFASAFPYTIAWTNVRGASTGTVDQSSTSTPSSVRVVVSIGGRGGSISLSRAFAWFDVSAYASSTSTNTISALTLKTLSGGNSSLINYTICKSVNAFSSATTTTLASGDFNSVFFNTLYASTALTWAAAGSAMNDTLNSSAINDANSNGKLNIVWIGYQYDQQDSNPASSFSFSGTNSVDQSNPGKIALTVTYAAAGFGKTVNTVLGADIVQVNTVNSADINELNTTS
jgi:hypothetical protein